MVAVLKLVHHGVKLALMQFGKPHAEHLGNLVGRHAP